MPKIEYSILMHRRLSHIKVRPKQVDYEWVEEPVNEFLEELNAFLEIWAGEILGQGSIIWRSKPRDLRDLNGKNEWILGRRGGDLYAL